MHTSPSLKRCSGGVLACFYLQALLLQTKCHCDLSARQFLEDATGALLSNGERASQTSWQTLCHVFPPITCLHALICSTRRALTLSAPIQKPVTCTFTELVMFAPLGRTWARPHQTEKHSHLQPMHLQHSHAHVDAHTHPLTRMHKHRRIHPHMHTHSMVCAHTSGLNTRTPSIWWNTG